MNVLLSHIDWSPLVYGVVMFIGLWVMAIKLKRGYWVSFLIDLSVFTLVFKLHGGTMAGGFSAMVAAMIAGVVFPAMFRSKK